jgi:hypothetical protein
LYSFCQVPFSGWHKDSVFHTEEGVLTIFSVGVTWRQETGVTFEYFWKDEIEFPVPYEILPFN